MRVAIVGAGAVGRSIAGELLANGHQVMLIEKEGRKVRTKAVPGAEWVQADACEVTSLEEAQLATCDVVVAATGDDKANLVVSLLAKTEFAVPRVVARVKDPRNEWLYTEAWGVDVAVSTPRVLAALVEEAVSVGDVVRLISFRKGAANLVEITLAEDTPWVGRPLRDVPLPRETVLTAVLRGERVITPTPDEPLEAGDELLFVTHGEVEEQLQQVLAPGGRRPAVARQPPPPVRWRCRRATTHRVTTSATAVSGTPSTSDQVPSRPTWLRRVERSPARARGRGTSPPTAGSARCRRASAGGPGASAARAAGRARRARPARTRPVRARPPRAAAAEPAPEAGQPVAGHRAEVAGRQELGDHPDQRPAHQRPRRRSTTPMPALRTMPSTKKSRACPENAAMATAIATPNSPLTACWTLSRRTSRSAKTTSAQPSAAQMPAHSPATPLATMKAIVGTEASTMPRHPPSWSSTSCRSNLSAGPSSAASPLDRPRRRAPAPPDRSPTQGRHPAPSSYQGL